LINVLNIQELTKTQVTKPNSYNQRYAYFGDIVVAVIKQAIPNTNLERLEVIKAVIVRTKPIIWHMNRLKQDIIQMNRLKHKETQMNRLKHKETQPKPQEQQARRNYRTKTQNKQVLPIEMTRNIKDLF